MFSPTHASELTTEGFACGEPDTPIIFLKEHTISSDLFSSDGKDSREVRGRERVRSEDHSPTKRYIRVNRRIFAIEELTNCDKVLRLVRPTKSGSGKKLTMISENAESDEIVLSCTAMPLNLARVETMADLESPMSHYYGGGKHEETPSVISVQEV